MSAPRPGRLLLATLCAALAAACTGVIDDGARLADLPDDGQFDYIVVGSGAGGGPLAARLARAGKSVLLLEAGDDAGDKLSYEVPVMHPRATEDPALAWWYFVSHYTDPTQQQRDSKLTPNGILYPRGGALGGSTAVNAMITVLPQRSDWDHIAELTGDPSWSADRMATYYDRVSEWLGVQQPDFSLAFRDLRIAGTVMGAVLAFTDAGHPGITFDPLDIVGDVKQLINLMSKNINDALRAGDTEGIFSFPLATRQRRRNGTRERILDTVEAGYPLTVRTRALVTHVLFAEQPDEEGRPRAIGVEYLPGAHLYRADLTGTSDPAPAPVQAFARHEVILSAGAFNTPQLLELSGIGSHQDLDAVGIPVRDELPGVGRNLQDRYEVGVVFDVGSDWRLLSGCTSSGDPQSDPCLRDWLSSGGGPYGSNGAVASILMRSDPSRPEPDIHMFGLPGVFKGYKPGYSAEGLVDHHHFSWVILKGHTDNRGGTVRLRSADPLDRPDIHFHYFDDGDVDQGQNVNDVTAVVNAVELVRSIAARTRSIPFFGKFDEVWPGPGVDTREKIAQWVKDEAWGHHASCSARIGADDDPMAVLDSHFRVRGTSGLRVVDASVFPRIPGTFIVLPIYMVSEKAADVILADADSSPSSSDPP